MTERLPEMVGRYEVLLPIASGGMATVYLARSRGAGGFEREVALKLTHAHLRENRDFAIDLVEEAKLAARIRHRNVVAVLDVGEDPQGLFLVMDYVEGDTLANLRRRSSASPDLLPPPIGLRILLDALAGLQAAHELCDDAGIPLGLVHRDFSPHNILVGTDGIGQLTDFGIAKAATRLGHTKTGLIKGKIAYMAPEQAMGTALDGRADVWAAGVIAWEIVTGKKLYPGDNDVQTLLRVVSQAPPRTRSAAPDVPPEIDEAVSQALVADPRLRCPSADAFARALSDACRQHGWVAERQEVSAWVRRKVEPKLKERRGKVAEVLALRAEMAKLAVAKRDSASSGQSFALDPAAASAVLRATAGASAIDEPTRDHPTARLPSGEIPASAMPGAAPPEITRTDTSAITPPRAQTSAKQGPATGVIIAGVAVGSIVFALLAAVYLGARRPAQNAQSSSVAVEPAPPVPATSSEPAPLAPSVPSATPSDTDPARTLVLSSNLAFRLVRVGGRSIPVEPPATRSTVGLTSEELARGAPLEVVGVDGSVVRVAVPSAGESLAVKFPIERPPAAKTPDAGGRPLAKNPYGTGK